MTPRHCTGRQRRCATVRAPVNADVFSDARLVVVDDHGPNVLALEALLAQWGVQHVFSTTQSAEAFGLCAHHEPDLVLLDLHMPEPDGFEVMRRLRALAAPGLPLPVLVLTADITSEARRRALSLGARDFLTKPFDPIEAELRVRNLLAARRHEQALAERTGDLEQAVRARTREVEASRLEVLDRLALAAEYRDDLTGAHTRRVAATARALAARLGIGAETLRLVELAAPLHDVGKIGIPDAVLRKAGTLAGDEQAVMRRHTLIGARMLTGSESPILRVAEEVALRHHERWDGTGYPDGLAGAAIPLTARIVAVADVFDALCCARPYKPPWSIDQAVCEVLEASGTQFDPDVVAAFAGLDHLRFAPDGRFARGTRSPV
jgi:putative two-component system response regulator